MTGVFDEILKRTDVVVQASTGGVSDMNIQDRCNPLDYPKVRAHLSMAEVQTLAKQFILILLMISLLRRRCL